MTRQQHADSALRRWQELRELPPSVRIEWMVYDFFHPPIDLDARFEDQIAAVAREMAHG
jgi:hypothetical protein